MAKEKVVKVTLDNLLEQAWKFSHQLDGYALRTLEESLIELIRANPGNQRLLTMRENLNRPLDNWRLLSGMIDFVIKNPGVDRKAIYAQFDHLGHTKVVSTINLLSGYNQILLVEGEGKNQVFKYSGTIPEAFVSSPNAKPVKVNRTSWEGDEL